MKVQVAPLLAFLTTQVLASPPVPRRLPLSWATSQFLAVEGSRLRLQHRFALGETPSVWLEAESASSLWLEANKTVGRDPEASGGRYVAYVDRLEFVVDVATAGTYQSWTRCFFPFAASWNHTEGVDPKDMRVVKDIEPAEKDKAGSWIWLEGPAYQLKPGVCTYVFDGYHGGAKLDKVLLTRDLDFVPQALGRRQSHNVAYHTTGSAETRDLRLGTVAKWLKLEGLPESGVTASVSLDGARSWQPVPPDGSLETIAARGNGKDVIRIRLELTRSESADPIVENVQLAYVPGEEKLWTIENEHLRLSFDPGSGSLLGIENLAGGRPVRYVISGEQQPLFCLFLQKPDKFDTLVPLSSLDAELTGHSLLPNGRKLTIDFALLDGALLVHCTFVADDTPLTRWNLRLSNRSTANVFGVQFPLLSNLRLGESPADDVMVLPWWGPGSRTQNPAGAEWSAFRKILNYPGSASMQWLDLHDPGGGLYVAAYDPTCHDLELGYTQNLKQSVNVTFKKSLLLLGGTGHWSCDYAVGVHPGDWHWGADRYREWARTWMRAPYVPLWVAEAEGWMMPTSCANLFGYPNLPLYYRLKNATLGMNWMQCWMQMTEAEHCCGQFHYPSPLWGTPEDFRWGCQGVHDQGGRIGFYINAQLFKPWHNSEATNIGAVPTEFIPKEVLAPYDPQWAFLWQAKDFADRPYDQPSPNPFDDGVRMNPASTGWQNHLLHWAADWYVGKFGADCIYFDQMSAAPSLPVYNEDKSDYGVWGIGYQQMLEKLLTRVLPTHPSFVTSMEGASDVHGQDVATALYGTDSDYFDVYHYTFPEHILIDFGAYVNQYDKTFGGPHAIYLNTFLMGTRFCEYPQDEFGHSLYRLRQRLKSLVYRATYRDTVKVTTTDPAVRAKRLVRGDDNCRAVLINLGNLGKKAGVSVTADVACLKRIAAGWVYGLDGTVQPLKCAEARGAATFEAPSLEAATAVFVEQTAPIVEEAKFPGSATTGSLVKGTATVRNLSNRPMKGQVKLIALRGWKSEPVAFANLQPGRHKTVELWVNIPQSAARDIHDLFVVVKGTGGEDRRYVSLAVVPPVEITKAVVRQDGLEATFHNRSPRVVVAAVSLDVFASAQAPAPQELPLQPGGVATVKFAVAWPDLSAARTPQTVRVAAEAEELKTVRSLAVGPPVINGSFDMAVVNKDKPEGWSVFGHGPTRVHVVRDQPFEGRACLYIEPGPGSPNVDQICSLQPDTTYQLSAALRRTDVKDNPLVWLTVHETWTKYITARLEFPGTDKTVNEWRVFSATLKTPPEIMSSWLYACNGAPTNPVWIDAVKVEKVK